MDTLSHFFQEQREVRFINRLPLGSLLLAKGLDLIAGPPATRHLAVHPATMLALLAALPGRVVLELVPHKDADRQHGTYPCVSPSNLKTT